MAVQKTAAIYAIRHISSGNRYIGGSIDLRRRWAEHRSFLARGVHWIDNLQADWSADGAGGFSFEILEQVPDPRDVLAREQVWLNGGEYHYNTSPTAGSCAGAVKGPLTDAHKAKLSAAKKGKPLAPWHREFLAQINRNRTPEHCAKISQAKKGKRPSDATRAKMSAAALGRVASESARNNISHALKGKPKSEAHKAALRKPKSEAHKLACSKARKAWWAAKKAADMASTPYVAAEFRRPGTSPDPLR